MSTPTEPPRTPLPPRRRRRGLIAAGLGAVALLAALAATSRGDAAGDREVTVEARRGDFRVTVTTTGELRAKRSVQVMGPVNPQSGIFEMKLASIVPEGTVVKEGDIVAELDRAAAAQKLIDVGNAMQKAVSGVESAQLDSAFTVAQARENLRNLEFAVQEKRIAKEQAIYEPPTVQRQADIDLQKAERAFEQGKLEFRTREQQSAGKVRDATMELERQRRSMESTQKMLESFTVRAPADGMVIYHREFGGRKRTVGSRVTPWEPIVATLPDLTTMESVTYVNEIEVRRVTQGQLVSLTLDADPDKTLSGRVTAVANIGEQRPNSDAKVFEVVVEIAESDTTLRPGMTTGNEVETAVLTDVVSVPLEALGAADSLAVVLVRRGGRLVRQEVRTGMMNDNEVVIVAGIEAGETVLLSRPASAEQTSIVRLPEELRAPRDSQPMRGDTGATLPIAPPAGAAGGARPPAAALPTPIRSAPRQ